MSASDLNPLRVSVSAKDLHTEFAEYAESLWWLRIAHMKFSAYSASFAFESFDVEALWPK